MSQAAVLDVYVSLKLTTFFFHYSICIELVLFLKAKQQIAMPKLKKSKKVRDDRKKLKRRYINEIRSREEVDFAYIPWNVLARILYKVKDSAKLKSFFLPD